MSRTLPGTDFVAFEAAKAFVSAMGHQRLAVADDITSGALALGIELLEDDDLDELRRRAIRCGRALADEAKRKRIRTIAALPLPPPEQCFPYASRTASRVTSKTMGVVLRCVLGPYPGLDKRVYRLDMLGTRARAPKVNA